MKLRAAAAAANELTVAKNRNVLRVEAAGFFFFYSLQRGRGEKRESPEEDWHSIYTEDRLVDRDKERRYEGVPF